MRDLPYSQEEGKPLAVVANHEVLWFHSQLCDDLLEKFSLLLLGDTENLWHSFSATNCDHINLYCT